MLFTSITPNFRFFLHTLLLSIKSRGLVALYYDIKILPKEDGDKLYFDLLKELSVYKNIVIFTDFVPGFLTNPDGASLFPYEVDFNLVIFFNFNPKSLHQRYLLNELNFAKIEYILISPYPKDIVKYVPFLYLELDLNDIVVFRIFRFYLTKYLSYNLDPRDHNSDFNYNILKINYMLFNLIYIYFLISKKDLCNNHLSIYFSEHKYKELPIKTLKSTKSLLKILSYKTETRVLVFKEFFDKNLVQSLFTIGKWIIKKVFNKIKKFIKEPDKFLDKNLINQFLKTQYSKKIGVNLVKKNKI